MRILTVNTGSTSLKLERYDLNDPLPPIAEPPEPAYTADEITAALRDPVDVVVNGTVIARGEIVVVDDASQRFGVSLLEVVAGGALKQPTKAPQETGHA